MKVIKIDKQQWNNGIASLSDAYRLFGPVLEKTFYNFKELGREQKPDFDYQNTRLSVKSIVFPQSEDMLTYSLDESEENHHIMKEAPKDYSPRAVLGVRPCDAAAIELVGLNFDTSEYKDPYWLNLYNATTLVGLACNTPCSTCFCTTTGCGPFSEKGLDILLVDSGSDYIVKVLTEKGEKLVQSADWKESDGSEDQIEALKQKAEEHIVSQIDTSRLADLDTLDLHGADFWEDISFACINCGTCTYVCPTCWCFDIQDEVVGKSGKRIRNWESCMFPIFTVHTTGHNPRDTKLSRVRQRFMHKLKYFVDKYQQGIMCVGCGRCVRQCPVNIDIRRVCDLMNSYGSDKACAV
jgi:ferredoxin